MLNTALPFYYTDSYKLGHADQYPADTHYVYSNFTARSEKLLPIPEQYKDGKYVVMGVRAFMDKLNKVWVQPLANMTSDDFNFALGLFLREMGAFVGPNGLSDKRFKELYSYVREHRRLPLIIKAVPDGTVLDIRTPCFTIQNNDPRFYWFVNYMESYISTELWKPMTTATIARFYRRVLEDYAKRTGSPVEFVDWQAHDFSMRGMSGADDGAYSGLGHLAYFTGTDNLMSMRLAKEVYFSGIDYLYGGSVPATEHSVMCMGGEDDELETFRRLVTQYNSGVVSIVSDTWDYFNVITNTALQLRDVILNRVPDQFGLAKVVFRPDSGNPIDIICGDPEAPEGSPERKGSLQCLWDIFGGTITATGHKLLNQRVGLIYGDSITPQRMLDILARMEAEGWASANLVFGVGSYTYQYLTRDSLGFAMKATWGIRGDKEVFLFKDPKTDSGTKKSARGKVAVVDGKLVDGLTSGEEDIISRNQLVPVSLADKVSLEDIRARLRAELTLR